MVSLREIMKQVLVLFLVVFSVGCKAGDENHRRILGAANKAIQGIQNCSLKPLNDYINSGYDVDYVDVDNDGHEQTITTVLAEYASNTLNPWNEKRTVSCPELKIEALRILHKNGANFFRKFYPAYRGHEVLLTPYIEFIKGADYYYYETNCFQVAGCKKNPDFFEGYDWKPGQKNEFYGIKKTHSMQKDVLDLFHKEFGFDPNYLLHMKYTCAFSWCEKELQRKVPLSQSEFERIIDKSLPEQGVAAPGTNEFLSYIGARRGWEFIVPTISNPTEGLSVSFVDPKYRGARAKHHKTQRFLLISPDMLDHYLSLDNYSLNSQYCSIPLILKEMKSTYEKLMVKGKDFYLKKSGLGFELGFRILRTIDSYEHALKVFNGKVPTSCEKRYFFTNSL